MAAATRRASVVGVATDLTHVLMWMFLTYVVWEIVTFEFYRQGAAERGKREKEKREKRPPPPLCPGVPMSTACLPHLDVCVQHRPVCGTGSRLSPAHDEDRAVMVVTVVYLCREMH